MPEAPSPSEVGFADFVATLIEGVYEAVMTSQIAQERQLADLRALAELSPAAFAERVIEDDDVTAELARLFPDSAPDQSTAIRVGAPYQRPTANATEQPPIAALLQITLERGDFVTRGSVTTLANRGVQRVRAAVRDQLAAQQHASVQQLVHRGVPRVMADAGRVTSKLTYQVVRSDADDADSTASTGLRAPLVSIGAAKLAVPASQRLRLTVRPADERAPQSQDLRVDVFGEVEISFSTVT